VHGVGAGLRVLLAGVPRLGVVEVLVAVARQGHRAPHGLAHPVVFVRCADVGGRRGERVEGSAVLLRRRTQRRHAPIENVLAEGERAVDEVAEDVGQLAVDAVLEAVPREVGVFRLRERPGGEGVAQQVGRVIRVVREVVEEFAEPDGPPARGGELAALDVEKLVGRHVVRQHERAPVLIGAVGHQRGRKHQAVKDDVVLADEMNEAWIVAVFIAVVRASLPVVAPAFGRALLFGPFLRGANVADGGVEPDVEDFAVGVREPFLLGHVGGDGDAPR